MSIFQDPQSGEWYQGPDHGSSGNPFGQDEEERLRARGVVRDPYSGDFYEVPQSSIPNWRRPEPIMAPQAPEPTLEDGVGIADYARSVMAGGAQIGQSAGWLMKQLGAEDVGGAIETMGRDAVDYWNEGLSDAAKDALSREFVRKNEAGEYEWGDANLHTVGLFGAQSLLGTMAGAGAGAGITKVLQTFANPVGRSALLRAAQAGSEQALKKLSLVDKVIGAAGFGAGEGLVGGASAGVNVYDRVMTMDPAKIMENPRYRQVYESTDETMPELERHQYAAETVAREASSLAGLQSGLTTALLGGPMGAYFGSVFGKSSIGKLIQSRATRAATGAAGEAAQEFAQGAAEQAIGNVAVRDAGDTDVDVWDDVLNQALGGALAGAPMGGVLGLAEQPEQLQTPSIEEMQERMPPPQETLALPAPRGEADFTVGPDGEAIPRGQVRPERPALPAPGANADFTVTSEGETIPRGEARSTPPDPMQQWARDSRAMRAEIGADQAARQQQETEALGQSPASRWTPETVERVKTAATEAVQAGADREAVLEVVRTAASGKIAPVAAMRRMSQLRTEASGRQALPAPRAANAFEVSPTGEARQLTEAEARQANDRVAEAQQARVDMGTAPTTAPGLGGKREQVVQAGWKADTIKRVRAAADAAVEAGVPREVADGVLARMSKGEVKPLIAARQLKQLQAAQSATTPTTQTGAPEQTPANVSHGTPETTDQGNPATAQPTGENDSIVKGAIVDQVMSDGTVLKTIDPTKFPWYRSKQAAPIEEKSDQPKPLLSRGGQRFAGRPEWDMKEIERQNQIDGTASEFAGIVQEEYAAGTQSAQNILTGFEFNAEQSGLKPQDLAEAAARALEKHPQATSKKAAALIREKYGQPKPLLKRGEKPADDTSKRDYSTKVKAGDQVDGRTVREEVPDMGSIPATLSGDYTVLPGIREVHMDQFTLDEAPPRKNARVQKLIKGMGESNEINPLIVAVDKDGPYILEGGHRYDALKALGAKSFPAVVVLEEGVENPYTSQREEAQGTTPAAARQPAPLRRAGSERFTRTQGALRSHRERSGPTSRSYTRASQGNGGTRRVLGSPTRAEFTPSAGFRGTLESVGAAAPSFHELTPEGAQTFADAISASKQGNRFGAAVYVYPTEEYAQMRLFLAEDGKAGFALKGDDIVSVFALAPHKGAAPGILELAVQEGGRRLDAFDTVLPDLYAANGFRTVARIGWNDDYAPEGWDKGTFAAFNGGEPDVVFMVYDPVNATAPTADDGQRVEDYDAAVALQKGAVEQKPLTRQGPVRQAVRDALGRVQKELADFTAGVAGLVNVQIHATVSDMAAATGVEIPGDTKGAWLPGTNTVHIVAENHAPGEAITTAVHETFGHLAIFRYEEGRRAVDSVTRQVAQGAAWTKPYVAEVTKTHGNLTDMEMAAEVIALMAERGEKNLTMTKLIAGIRRFLRKLGVKIDYSDADIRDLIARSARALKQEAAQLRPKLAALTPAATDQQILDAIEEQFPANVVALDSYMALRAARETATGELAEQLDAEIASLEGRKPEGDSTLRLKKPLRSADWTIELDRVRYPVKDANGKPVAETPEQQRNFWRWFRSSQVTDSRGRPLVMYHGTTEDIETFDPGHETEKDSGFYGRGIYFTADPESASAYSVYHDLGNRPFENPPTKASRVMPVYLDVKNPYIWPTEREAIDSPAEAAAVRKELEAQGYDGVFAPAKNADPKYADHYEVVVFRAEQIKSAIGNAGTFDPSNPSILFRRGAAQADPKVQAILDRVMIKPPEAMTMRDKARELWHKITDTSGLQLKQGFIDSFASIEALERAANNGALKDAADSAYKAALATKNLSSVMAGVMLKGVPQFVNGAYVPVAGRRGIIDIFNPLTQHKDGNLLSQWEGYAAARRASRLIQETNVDGSSRENLFTQDEIDTLLTLGKKYPEFDTVFNEWQAFNKQVLDLAQDAGIIDPDTRVLWERNDYVPFYRVAEELGSKTGPSNKAGLANQSSGIRSLKGGEAQLGNVFENMMMNTAHLIDASFKNRAMQRIVDLGTGVAMDKVDLDWQAVKFNDAQLAAALRKAGIEVESMDKAQREHWSTLFRRIAPKGPGIVSVMVNGKPEYYDVTDPLVLQSIAGLGYDNFADVFGLFRGSKKLLTNAITADPAFMMANFVRDTLSNWVISDASTKPMVDAVKALGATLKDDPDLVNLMMAGAGGGGFYDSAPEDIRKLIADRVPPNQQRAFLDSVVGPKNVWRVWRKIGAAAENANRIATFRAVLAAGGSVAEAAYQARDVLNFSMAGNFGAMRWMTQSVPFLNARIQGLYRLYRGARDNKRAFFTKGLMLTAATMALALSNEDDDRYEELPEWDKDTYWHLFLGDEHYRIPKPFEVGGLFSTIPERVYRAATGRDSAGILADRMYQMFSDTFAFNPVPQLVKPIIEQYANRSMFTGSPIVGMAEQPLQPEAQFTPWTSETMQELAKAMPDFAPAWLRSPKRLEAALRAYTGAIGMYILGASDQVVRTAMGYPAEPGRKLYDLPVVSRFWKDPDPRHTKYADQLYEMMDEANAISSTINRYTRERRFEEAAELRNENKSKLAVRVRLNRLGEQVRNVNNRIRLIQLDQTMDPGTKRERIDALVSKKNDITRQVARYSDIF